MLLHPGGTAGDVRTNSVRASRGARLISPELRTPDALSVVRLQIRQLQSRSCANGRANVIDWNYVDAVAVHEELARNLLGVTWARRDDVRTARYPRSRKGAPAARFELATP